LAKVKNAWVTQNKKKNNCLSINYEGKLKNFRKVRKTGDRNSFHDLIIVNTPMLTSEHAIKTLSNSLLDSKKHGLGKILIQEFSEKLQSTIRYAVQDDCIAATFSMPHSFKTFA
jgi:hypothetical protein